MLKNTMVHMKKKTTIFVERVVWLDGSFGSGKIL
jgi:hypothetical protein